MEKAGSRRSTVSVPKRIMSLDTQAAAEPCRDSAAPRGTPVSPQSRVLSAAATPTLWLRCREQALRTLPCQLLQAQGLERILTTRIIQRCA